MNNIMTREQYEEKYHGSDYDDWHYESIRFRYHPGKTTMLKENTEQIGRTYNEKGNYWSWPGFIEVEVEGVWKWSQTIETGGYFEVYDVAEDGERFFRRCVCEDEQFVSYIWNNITKQREEMICPHCWLKQEEE